jgi:hypothetical protein
MTETRDRTAIPNRFEHTTRCGRLRPARDRTPEILPPFRHTYTAFDDLAGDRVTVARGSIIDDGGTPTVVLQAHGDAGDIGRATLCRAMAAETVAALERFLAESVDDGHRCEERHGADVHTVHLLLAETLRAIVEHDTDYDVRGALVWRALALAASAGMSAGVNLDPRPADPRFPLVVYIELPTGQVSWHMPTHRTGWDEHTTAAKFTRIEQWADRVVTAGRDPATAGPRLREAA